MKKNDKTLSYQEAERAKASTVDESNKGDEQAKRTRLKKVCGLLNDIDNNIKHPEKILNYVRTQIETYGHLIGGVGFIDYIKSNLVDNPALTIWGRGNPLLDEDKIYNLYELLDTLKIELSKRDYIRQENVESSEPQQASNGQTTGELNLPSELDTEKARKCFAKAINANYMVKTDRGFKWNFGGEKGKIRLGYFCNKIYSTPRPISKLEEIFCVKKLSASITYADYEVKRADVIKWRKEIDDTIFKD